MIPPKLEFGLFIVCCGVITFFHAWGKKDNDTVFVGRLGVTPTSAKAVKTWGKTLIIAGALLSIVSLS